MIRAFTITNYLGNTIELDLRRPELSGFLIKSVSGLDPAKATINTSEVSAMDGSVFNSARVTQRNIVFSIAFVDSMQGETIEDLRQKLYKYFPPKKQVEIAIETDNRWLKTVGYVESTEVEIFSSLETAQVSVICPDPYFYSAGYAGSTEFFGVIPTLEFPLDIDLDNSPDLEMSRIQNEHQVVLNYTGDAEVGIVINIHALGEASNIEFYNLCTRETMRIDTDKLAALTGSGIVAGDDIVIDTIRGEKSVFLIRNGEVINILNCLDQNSDWFTIVKGDNLFAFTADTGELNLQCRIENRIVYGGI